MSGNDILVALDERNFKPVEDVLEEAWTGREKEKEILSGIVHAELYSYPQHRAGMALASLMFYAGLFTSPALGISLGIALLVSSRILAGGGEPGMGALALEPSMLVPENGFVRKGGYPQEHHFLLERKSAIELANVSAEGIGHVMGCAMHVAPYAAEQQVSPHKKAALSAVFQRAIGRRCRAIPDMETRLGRAWDERHHAGLAVGAASFVAGVLAGFPEAQLGGVLLGALSMGEKSNWKRCTSLGTPESHDPDCVMEKVPDGILLSVTDKGARRLACADPEALGFVISQAQRLLEEETPARKPKAPAPAPK